MFTYDARDTLYLSREELGMTNVPFNSLDDYRDIETFNSYKQLVEIENR